MTVFVEAIVVGISVLIAGTLISSIVSYAYEKQTNASWGVTPMVISLFLTGFFLHYFYEVTGLNAYYVNMYCK